MVWFVCGLFIGSMFGYFIAALMVAAHKGD